MSSKIILNSQSSGKFSINSDPVVTKRISSSFKRLSNQKLHQDDDSLKSERLISKSLTFDLKTETKP